MIGMGEFRAQFQYIYNMILLVCEPAGTTPSILVYTIIYLYFDIFCIISKWFCFQTNETRKCFNSFVSPIRFGFRLSLFDLVAFDAYVFLFYSNSVWALVWLEVYPLAFRYHTVHSLTLPSNEWHVLKMLCASFEWNEDVCLCIVSHLKCFDKIEEVSLVLNGRHKKKKKKRKEN